MVYDVRMPFTRASWGDHVQALSGVSEALEPDRPAVFDEEHARILEVSTPECEFTVLHRIDAHISRPAINIAS